MITAIVLLALIGLTALRRKAGTRLAIICFATSVSFVLAINPLIPTKLFHTYYLLAATVDAAIIYSLSKIKQLNRDIIIIQIVCLVFIYANLFGFIGYELYIDKIYYNALCYLTYVALLIMLNMDMLNVGFIDKLRWNINSFYLNHRCVALQLQNNKKAA